MGAGESPEPHQRHRHGNLRDLGELANFVGGIAKHRAAADVDDRPLRLHDRFSRLLDLRFVAAGERAIAAQIDLVGIFEFGLGRADIFGNIDQHRPGPSAGRDVKRFLHRLGEIVHVFHQHIVLGAGPADTDIIGFLKRIVADEICRNLPGKRNQRHRIHVRIGQAGDDIGHARARGHQHNASLAGRFSVALRHMSSALLVASQYQLQIFALAEHIENLQDNAAGQTENGFHPFAA